MNFPSIHDGRIVGIKMEGKNVHIEFLLVDESRGILLLTGVRALQMEDFREGNIVYRAELISNQKLSREVLAKYYIRLFPPPDSGAERQYHDKYENHLAQITEDIGTGNAVIVSITPSYGANLVAHCEAVTFHTA